MSIDDYLAERAKETDRWIDSEISRVAPHLADTTDAVNRWLENVQRMLVAGNPMEARQYADAVARSAHDIALSKLEWTRLRVDLASRAPVTSMVLAQRDMATRLVSVDGAPMREVSLEEFEAATREAAR